MHQSDIFQNPQMLGDGLAREARAMLQLNRRQWSVTAKSRNDRQANGIAERGEDCCCIGQSCGWNTPFSVAERGIILQAQDTFR